MLNLGWSQVTTLSSGGVGLVAILLPSCPFFSGASFRGGVGGRVGGGVLLLWRRVG